jgi:hypothetical protein
MTAWQEATEPTSVSMKSVAMHKEIPEEEAAVKTGKALKKRHRGRHLAAGRRGKPKEQTESNGRRRKRLTAARRRVTRRAGVA